MPSYLYYSRLVIGYSIRGFGLIRASQSVELCVKKAKRFISTLRFVKGIRLVLGISSQSRSPYAVLYLYRPLYRVNPNEPRSRRMMSTQ